MASVLLLDSVGVGEAELDSELEVDSADEVELEDAVLEAERLLVSEALAEVALSVVELEDEDAEDEGASREELDVGSGRSRRFRGARLGRLSRRDACFRAGGSCGGGSRVGRA